MSSFHFQYGDHANKRAAAAMEMEVDGKEPVMSLEQRILQVRRDVAMMASFDDTPASALLHPLSPSEKSSHADVEALIADVQATLNNFISQSDSLRGPHQANILATLREQSTHNHAICELRDQIRHFGMKRKATSSNHFLLCALIDFETTHWPTNDLTKAHAALHAFVTALEKLAEDKQLESFAEQNVAEDDAKYTLTLAGKILVIDAYISVQQASDTFYRPSVKVKVSFATDTSQKERGGQLASVIQSNIEAVAVSIFGLADADERTIDNLCETIETLKRYDRLSSTFHVEGFPDLFALLDDLCASAHADTQSVRPYTFRTNPDFSLLVDVDSVLADEALRLEVEQGNVNSSKNGRILQLRALLHPPLPMTKAIAHRLVRAAGVIDIPKKSTNAALPNDDIEACSIDDLLAKSANSTSKATQPAEQAILVKQIPIASVRRLQTLYDELTNYTSSLTIPNHQTPSNR